MAKSRKVIKARANIGLSEGRFFLLSMMLASIHMEGEGRGGEGEDGRGRGKWGIAHVVPPNRISECALGLGEILTTASILTTRIILLTFDL